MKKTCIIAIITTMAISAYAQNYIERNVSVRNIIIETYSDIISANPYRSEEVNIKLYKAQKNDDKDDFFNFYETKETPYINISFNLSTNENNWEKYDKKFQPTAKSLEITLLDEKKAPILSGKKNYSTTTEKEPTTENLTMDITSDFYKGKIMDSDDYFDSNNKYISIEISSNNYKELTAIYKKITYIKITVTLEEFSYSAEMEDSLSKIKEVLDNVLRLEGTDALNDSNMDFVKDFLTAKYFTMPYNPYYYDDYDEKDYDKYSKITKNPESLIDKELLASRNIPLLNSVLTKYYENRKTETTLLSYNQKKEFIELWGKWKEYANDIALPLLLESARGGNNKAQLYLGIVLDIGNVRLHNYDDDNNLPMEPIHWYAKSAMNGNSMAEKFLKQYLVRISSPYYVNKIIEKEAAIYHKWQNLGLITKEELDKYINYIKQFRY
jgi:hypothetical protein